MAQLSVDHHLTLGALQAAAFALAVALAPAGWAQTAVEYGTVVANPKVAAPAPRIAASGSKSTATKKTPEKAAGAPKAEALPPMPVCSGELPAPIAVGVISGKSTLVKFPNAIALRTLADNSVAQARLLSPQTLYILGTRIGSTNMILQDTAGRCTVIDVTVGMDPEALRGKLLQLMPDEVGVKVTAAADSLVLSGVVSDAMKVDQALSLANAYVRQEHAAGAAGAAGNAGGGGAGQNIRVINMLSVASPQQVMIEVKVAEVSKKLTDKLGASFSAQGSSGSWKYGVSSSFPSGGAALINAIKLGNLALAIDAQDENTLVKILAEPNVMAISGQEGSFLAGGKVYIPVPQSGTGGIGTTVTLQEEDFGIGLKFTPTVLAGGLINLRIAPEVSDFSPQGLAISAPGVAQTAILPLINTRRASTTVQLYDGQSFVIGGLIKNNVAAQINAFPVLGEIPILGALFRSSQFATDRSEVLFVVTPRLVKPIAGDRVGLPTDNYIEPSRFDVFLGGRLEGQPPEPAPNQPAPAASAQPTPPPAAPKADAPSGFVVK